VDEEVAPPRGLRALEADGHEEVVFVHDRAAGLRAIIALHDTTLGPAVGGTRMRPYPGLEEALAEVLRLSRAMTYKAAVAGVDYGGGKAVIFGDPARDKTRALLSAYGRAVDRLGGRFHTGGDMGIDARDVAVIGRHTKHVSHTPASAGVDTAELAALGVFESIRAAARWWERDLAGLHVAVQGLGQVGARLARQLARAGARLTVCDVDPGRVERLRAEVGALAVEPDAIYDVEADVLSPNAAGAILDDATVPRLRCRAVIGAANEQLALDRHGDALAARGILYGPDYVVNAGGLLSLLFETGQTDEDGVVRRVRGIGDRVLEIWRRAREEGRPPHRVADTMAEERLAAAQRRR
jgi:glutamate dehydrogenase/leucine dehydrogenase